MTRRMPGTLSEAVAYDVVTDSYFVPDTGEDLDYNRGEALAQSELQAGLIVVGVNDGDPGECSMTDSSGCPLGVQTLGGPLPPLPEVGTGVPEVRVAVDRSSLLPWVFLAGVLWLASK